MVYNEIDVSYQAVASGMVSTICMGIKNSLDELLAMCNNNTVNVAFMSFDSTIHFYRLAVCFISRLLLLLLSLSLLFIQLIHS